MTPHQFLQSHVAEILRSDSWFETNRIRIIEQNSADILEEIEKADAQSEGIAIVVAVDHLEPINSNPPQLACEFSLLISEFPAVNRIGNFVTALDAAHYARCCLFAADPSLIWRGTNHATPGYGLLVATVKYNTNLIEER